MRGNNPYNIDKNVHYFALMRKYSSIVPSLGIALVGSEVNWAECEIIEDRYIVDDGYKVTLRPIDKEFAEYSFYQMDFDDAIRHGYIVKKDDENLCIRRDEWIEPICGCAFVRHSGFYVG